MIVSVARLTLVVPHSHSLKEKRSCVRKVKDKVRAKFGVRIAEVGGLDTWQRAVLGFAVVSGDAEYARGEVDSVIRYIEDMGVGNLVRADRETMTYDDEGLA